jgi:membrane protease YdiL (CAAX protease family)
MPDIENLFFKGGRLRPFIRFLISGVGILACFMLISFVAVAMPLRIAWLPGQLTPMLWFNLPLLPALLVLYAILTRLFDHRPLGSVGIAFHPRWKIELAIGLAAGAAMILAVGGAEGLLGFARFSLSNSSAERTVVAGAFLFVLLVVSAADEELIFRGYPFQRLVDSVGPVIAVIVVSVLFGTAHLWNPFHTWISTLNTAVVGVLLAVCYLRTRALWLPFGIHFAWNFVQGSILGLPVSGLTLPSPVLDARVSGPLWLTGGAYGPEGSILTLGVLAAGTAYFIVSGRISTTAEMRKLALGSGDEEELANPLFSGETFPTGKT